jgi:hypothetical protein
MLGKIAGDKTGITKKVSPIVVKVGLINGPADWLYATSLVSRGLGPDPGLNNPSSTRCVVLLPFQFPSDDTGVFPQQAVFMQWQTFFYRILLVIGRKGCLLVTGSGNNNFVFGHLAPVYVRNTELGYSQVSIIYILRPGHQMLCQTFW